jgi:hypothetical protein
MIRKSGYRFSEKIMLKQKDGARCRFNQNASRSSLLESVDIVAVQPGNRSRFAKHRRDRVPVRETLAGKAFGRKKTPDRKKTPGQKK